MASESTFRCVKPVTQPRLSGWRIGELLLAYQCPFCCLFHVGDPPSRKRIEAERKLKRYVSCKSPPNYIATLQLLTDFKSVV